MKKIVSLTVVALCCLQSCGTKKSIAQKPETNVSITHKEWIVVEIENEKIELSDPKRFPSMTLSDGTVSGHGSCNRFHGPYTLKDNRITFGNIVATKMFCMDTQKTEDKYMKALQKVQRWEYKDNQLCFLDDKNQVVIRFQEKEGE
ncbi:MAG: META domain-containing protein [Bacteroidales bacterium]|jgi:heat shock protein HslJ|nr:META domain-containing protein [Bacteroidales bacterium]